jgi:DNA-binding transcriptional ArsR family regulator
MSDPESSTLTLLDSAPIFAALGDGTRLQLLDRLGEDGPQSITRLSTGSAITRQAVTKHLLVLADAGLVHDARRGRERIWSLDTGRLSDAGRSLEHFSRQWDAALARLKAFVEEEP